MSASVHNIRQSRFAMFLASGDWLRAWNLNLHVWTSSTVGSSAIWRPASRVLRRICTLVSVAVKSIVAATIFSVFAIAVKAWEISAVTFGSRWGD
jgi:lipopolysaccharide/colanic/teichoic acid biosynthesis glycosyltransferase